MPYKWEKLWLIVFLGFLVMCLCTIIFLMLLEFAQQRGEHKRERERDRRENEKAALVLREQREKFEQLLKAVKTTEKEKE